MPLESNPNVTSRTCRIIKLAKNRFDPISCFAPFSCPDTSELSLGESQHIAIDQMFGGKVCSKKREEGLSNKVVCG